MKRKKDSEKAQISIKDTIISKEKRNTQNDRKVTEKLLDAGHKNEVSEKYKKSFCKYPVG